MSNLERYAFGLSPSADDATPWTMGARDGYAYLNLPLARYATDLVWELQHTPSLQNNSSGWIPISDPESTTTATGEVKTVSVRLPTAPAEASGFFRTDWALTEPLRIRDPLDDGYGWKLLNLASFASSVDQRFPTKGSHFFRHSTPSTWSHSAIYKDTGLALREGTYLITFDVGHDGNNNRPFATNNLTIGFFDTAAAITAAGSVRDAIVSFRGLPGVSSTYVTNPPPLNNWQHWAMEFIVAPGSSAIGKRVSFGFHGQSVGTGGNQANFDNLVIRGPSLTDMPHVARVRVDTAPQQTMIYGMDFERLWHFREGGVEIDYDELAYWAVEQCRVDYVRVAISGGAELQEGDFRWEVYDRQLAIMRAIAAARPDIQWFASPRPIHNDLATQWERQNGPYTCFPLWISVWHDPFNEYGQRQFLYLDSTKGAQYYARYLQFMRQEGIEITYLDAINESTVHLKAGPVLDMVDALRDIMEDLNEPMPLVIAPSAHNRPEANKWIRDAMALGRADGWEITASHNTSDQGSLPEFAELAKRLDRPIWNTEMHAFQGPDDVAVRNTEVLFSHIRAGYGGINDWLSLGNEAKEHKMFRNINGQLHLMRIYYIFRQLVNTSGGGRYLHTDPARGLTSTVAFIKEDAGLITVWALNNSAETVDTLIEIPGYACQPVEVRWWGPANGREGSVITNGLAGASSLLYPVEGDSLYCFTFALDP